jgi:hypothetical protein
LPHSRTHASTPFLPSNNAHTAQRSSGAALPPIIASAYPHSGLLASALSTGAALLGAPAPGSRGSPCASRLALAGEGSLNAPLLVVGDVEEPVDAGVGSFGSMGLAREESLLSLKSALKSS